MERIFDFKDIPEETNVKLVAFILKKYAFLWVTNLCIKRVSLRKEKISTWDEMKAKFESHFLPPSYL